MLNVFGYMPSRHSGEEEVKLYPFSIPALGGCGLWALRFGHFTPGNEIRYPFYRKLCGPRNRSGWIRKISPPPSFEARIVHPVANLCTDCAVPAVCSMLVPTLNCPHSCHLIRWGTSFCLLTTEKVAAMPFKHSCTSFVCWSLLRIQAIKNFLR
jgi:hypothetical protein